MKRSARSDTILDIERALFGGLWISPKHADIVRGIIAPESFSIPAHASAYKAILSQINAQGEVELISLIDDLEAAGALDGCGGKMKVMDWQSACAGTAHIEIYAERIAKEHRRRKLRDACEQAAANLDDGDPSEVAGVLLREVEKASANIANSAMTAGEIFDHNRSAAGNVKTLPTGFPSIDAQMSGGIACGSLTIVGAGTSVGKTQFAVNLAYNVCGKGGRVLYIVQEMGPHEIEDRFVALMTSLPQIRGITWADVRSVRQGTCSQSAYREWAALYQDAVETFKKLRLRVVARGPISVDELRAYVARYATETDLVIVDYLQQLTVGDRRMERRHAVEHASAACKQMAMRYNLPVVLLSQLSRDGSKRGSEGDADGRPKLWNLRESGAIEQDADTVFLLWRKKEKDATKEDLEVGIEKQRQGPTGTKVLRYRLSDGLIWCPPEWAKEDEV